MPSALGAYSLSHWSIKEVLVCVYLTDLISEKFSIHSKIKQNVQFANTPCSQTCTTSPTISIPTRPCGTVATADESTP